MRLPKIFVLLLGLTAPWMAQAQSDPCPGVDPRAYLSVGVCKIPNISQVECTRIGGASSFYNSSYG
jgi:hypothetical protein